MTFFGLFHLYGLIIGIGIAAGVWIVELISKHFKKDPDWLGGALPAIIIGAIVGARMYHLLTDWQLYTQASLLDLVAVWRGGVGFLGGIIGGLIGLCVWMKLNSKLETKNLFVYLDLLVFGIPIAQAIGRLGNYVNKELYGLPTTLPWGITIDGQKYHPLFLYEAILNFFLFIILCLLARKKSLVLGKGQYLSIYLFGYALIRFWLEYLRIQTARLPGIAGVFSIAQWVTLGMMIVATLLFWVRRHAAYTKGGAPKKNWDFSLE